MSKLIKSDAVIINRSEPDIFNFISDFNNFGHLMPEQVVNYQSQVDSCFFEIKGLATLGLRIVERQPFSKVIMKGEGKLPFDFSFIYSSKSITDTSTETMLTIDADMNPFMAMMAVSPLQNFVNLLADKLKEIAEAS
jgi:hypothetical protein